MQRTNFDTSRFANCMDGVATSPCKREETHSSNRRFVVRFRLPQDKYDREMRVAADEASEAIRAVQTAYPQANIREVV